MSLPKLSLRLLLVFFGVLFLFAASVGGLILYTKLNLPSFATLRSSVEMKTLRSDGSEGTRRVGPKAPGWVTLERISDYLIMSVISSEDTSFFSHSGIDLHEVQEAIRKDIREKRWARGASTLTQQVVKNVFLSSEKSLWRKFREVIWASELEKELTKHEILCFYLNMAEWGPGIYGIGQASTYYFSILPSRLSVKEAAFLAMLLPAPRTYYTYFVKKKLTPWAGKRVNQIIETMHRMGFIDEGARDSGLQESLWHKETDEDEGLEDQRESPDGNQGKGVQSEEPAVDPDLPNGAEQQ